MSNDNKNPNVVSSEQAFYDSTALITAWHDGSRQYVKLYGNQNSGKFVTDYENPNMRKPEAYYRVLLTR